jgi:hypothetical protein
LTILFLQGVVDEYSVVFGICIGDLAIHQLCLPIIED